jgi:dCTP deaminase
LVRTGSRLSQIRLRQGTPILSDEELGKLHQDQQLLTGGPAIFSNGLAISIDLQGGEAGLIGYRAKHHTSVVDVDKKAALDVHEFWEPIYRHDKAELILDPDEFYILVSREAVHVPPDYAAEMVPFDPLVGEFRVHYAGFFDPGFGHIEAGGGGSRAVLEVRSHEVPFLLDHGQVVGRLIYETMQSRPDRLYGKDVPSNYQGQSLKLSKHFKQSA